MNDTIMAAAFSKVGLPVAMVSFASACHDLARLALNQTKGDARKATATWVTMASSPRFMEKIEEFLAAVAQERREQNAGEAQQVVPQGHAGGAEPATQIGGEASIHVPQGHDPAASPPVPNAATGAIFDMPQGQRMLAPSAVPNAAAEVIRRVPEGQTQFASTAAPPKPLTRSRVSGITHAKEVSARVMSGVYLTERQGSKTQLDDIAVMSLSRRLKWHGTRAAASAVEYNTLWLVREQVNRHAFVPQGAIVGDVLDAHSLQQIHGLARAFAASPMVQLPEALRREIAA